MKIKYEKPMVAVDALAFPAENLQHLGQVEETELDDHPVLHVEGRVDGVRSAPVADRELVRERHHDAPLFEPAGRPEVQHEHAARAARVRVEEGQPRTAARRRNVAE